MSAYKIGDTLRSVFGTCSFSTGAATDADSTPTCVVLDQGTPMGYAPAIGHKATGLYEVAIVCSLANGFTVGHEYTAYVVIVVGGTTVRGPVVGGSSFILRASSTDDVPANVLAVTVEGSNKMGDMLRLIAGVLAGKVADFTTGTLVFKSMDSSKTRLTVTTDATGRLTTTIGDLT